MARQHRFSREEAIDFLRGNHNYQEIARDKRGHLLAPEDLSTPQLKRYASQLNRALITGKHYRDLSELRGHTASEHHAGRGSKRGMEHWTPPERIPRRQWFPVTDTRGRDVPDSFNTVTSGEATAVRSLARAANHNMQVAVSLIGPHPGDAADFFFKGGYSARRLLEAAGYEKGKGGRWHLKPGGRGLESWFLDQLEDRHYDLWGVINLYVLWMTAKPMAPQYDERRHQPALGRGTGRGRRETWLIENPTD